MIWLLKLVLPFYFFNMQRPADKNYIYMSLFLSIKFKHFKIKITFWKALFKFTTLFHFQTIKLFLMINLSWILFSNDVGFY